MEEDRSALFNQLKNFSQRKLKKVETKVVTASGEQLVEKRGAKGLQVLAGDGASNNNQDGDERPRKLDLQVGLILPGLLLGSQDVAHDKSSLDSYGITHILNVDSEIENKFEDDFNYKNITMQDKPDYDLNKVLEDCFDFIDDGRHYGNVFIHCSGTIGLSRSTAVCIAYLMNKEKQKFDEAFNNVKEIRSFVKPNEGFVKQLRDYEVKLRGAQEIKESGIDDPFALRKKQEIEQEKAMVAGAASVKNRMKMFGATLDTNAASRSKSVSPSPFKSPTTPSPAVSKWSSNRDAADNGSNKSISKSMTPEPKKTWQTTPNAKDQTSATAKPDWRSASKQQQPGGPPPPPMPTGLHDDKSIKPLSNSSNRSSFPPPPPPPQPPAGELLKGSSAKMPSSSSPYSDRAKTSDSHQVFGKVPPPPMKISGGLSIERRDSTSDKNMGFTKTNTHSPRIEPATTTSCNYNPAQPPNRFGHEELVTPVAGHQTMNLNERFEFPLVLHNNVPPRFSRNCITSTPQSPQVDHGERQQNPFNIFRQLAQSTLGSSTSNHHNGQTNLSEFGQLPKRTMSLGQRRLPPPPKICESMRSPFLQERSADVDRGRSFNKMADELKSSLTELNNLIDSVPSTPRISKRPPKFTSYLTSTNEIQPTYAKECNNTVGGKFSGAVTTSIRQPTSSPTPEQLTDWQIDSMNWKASSSVTDLRSTFEQPKLVLHRALPQAPRPQLLSSIAISPNILRNSPWQTMSSPRPQSGLSGIRSEADYTIRRTTSTLSKASNVRNSYRSHYGNYY